MNDNKRIVVNSIILYGQLGISTIVGLLTTRLVLLQLGASDFGLYTVVGGIVTMMGFLSTAMLATSYRYIAIELGKGDKGDINKTFNTLFIIHLILAVILIIIGEPLGVWYIRYYLNVAPNKIVEAIFVLHFTIIVSVLSILSVPYRGLITARENFIIRSIVEILGTIIKLVLILLLTFYLGNKLKAYTIIMAVVTIIPSSLIVIYCWIKDRKAVSWKLNINTSDYKELFSYAGWISVGTIAYMGVRQGASIIINLFFGTVINAAFGIASQINNYIMMYVKNLNQAAVPQIMKSHSGGDSGRSMNLVYYVSKYSFFIMLLPAVPLILSIDSILILWLKKVPEYTKEFIILMIVNGLIGVATTGFDAIIQATGKIRKVQFMYSISLLLTLPAAYLSFKSNYPPYTITLLFIAASILYRFIQINILSNITEFRVSEYLNRTIWPTFLVSLLTAPQLLLRKLFGHDMMGILSFSVVSVLLILLSVYFIGLTKSERLIINRQLSKMKMHLHKG